VDVNGVTYTTSVVLYFAPATSVTITETSSSPWVFSYGKINQAAPFYDTFTPQSVVFLGSNASAYMQFLNTNSSRHIDVSADPPAGGTVTWSFTDNGTVVTKTGSGYAPASATVTISVTAGPLYDFIYWSGDLSGISSTVTSPASAGNVTATAHLALLTDVISFTVNIEGSGTVNVIINGTPVTAERSSFTLKTSVNYTTELDATPDKKYSFSHWTVNGSDVSANSITLAPGDAVTAVFIANSNGTGVWWMWVVLAILVSSLFIWWLILRKDED
jgi:hypothetical protein